MRRSVLACLTIIIVLVLAPAVAIGQGKWNFPDRKAIILYICPHVQIMGFTFENTIEGRGFSPRNTFTYLWKNVSPSPVLAFEVVTLKYDPFDEPMIGSRTLVTGTISADFTPLQPGEASGDEFTRHGHTHVLTAITYVRTVRFTDGTLWRADPGVVAAEVKRAAPRIKDAGPLVPEREKKEDKKP